TNNMVPHYHNWDFFLSCSPKEGFGLAIAEALMCGLQSVILDCGGVTHYIEHGKHAYIGKDFEDVSKGVQRVVESYRNHGPFYDPSSLDLSAKTMAKKYLELYDSLLAEAASKGGMATVVTTAKGGTAAASGGPILGITPEGWLGIRHSLEKRATHITTPEG